MTTYAKYPQVVFAVDFSSRMLLAAVPGRARGSDLVQFGAALRQAVLRARIGTFLADTDFDAEWVHRGVRSHGIRTIIPGHRVRGIGPGRPGWLPTQVPHRSGLAHHAHPVPHL